MNYEIHIKAVGDICPGDSFIEGLGILSKIRKNGYFYPFEKIISSLKDKDILIGNLEGSLSRLCYDKPLNMCGPAEFAYALKKAGFDVISIANNHVFDNGVEIFFETVKYLKRAGVKVCGLRARKNFFCKPVIIHKKMLKIGILAYNWVGLETMRNISNYIAVVSDGIVNYTWFRNKQKNWELRLQLQERNKNVISDIRKLKKEVDVLILIAHWGYEWTIYPPYGVILEARHFIREGADIIIGSHPHVPQGIENFNNKIIAYSLGNFIFDSPFFKSRFGIILDCFISKKLDLYEFKYSITEINKEFQPELGITQHNRIIKNWIRHSTHVIRSKKASCVLDDEKIYKRYEKEYNILKIKKVILLSFLVLKYPKLIKAILKKINNLYNIIKLRIKGIKIRW